MLDNEKIDALEAGAELDRLIAEVIFDWSDFQQVQHTSDYYGYRQGGTLMDRVPRYSRDMTDAWLVAEKLRLAIQPAYHGAWEAYGPMRGIWQGSNWRSLTIARADTAPLAICRAALKEALRADNDD